MIEIKSVSDRVYDVLSREIVSGVRACGSGLAEEELARAFRVSRTPIREALRRLKASGLVEIRTNHGAVVRTLDAEEVRQIYEVREALESKAVELACAACHGG